MVNKTELKRQIEETIERFAEAKSRQAYAIVPDSLTSGKIYEAHVLSLVIERLVKDEGFRITLVNTNHIPLKSSPGPINRSYPYFLLERYGDRDGELWTDVEFVSLSHAQSGNLKLGLGDYHELDIVVTDRNVIGRPRHDQVWLGIECKNTGYSKAILKAILGIRRELSLLDNELPTRFRTWPRSRVPANPSSCLLLYSTDANVSSYDTPGEVFGIDFIYEPI